MPLAHDDSGGGYFEELQSALAPILKLPEETVPATHDGPSDPAAGPHPETKSPEHAVTG